MSSIIPISLYQTYLSAPPKPKAEPSNSNKDSSVSDGTITSGILCGVGVITAPFTKGLSLALCAPLLSGCSDYPKGLDPICQASDSYPQTVPEGVDPITTPENFTLQDLETESGVTVTWAINIAACDWGSDGMMVKIPFPDETVWLRPEPNPDGEGGIVTITKTFRKDNWPTQYPIDAYLYYWNPSSAEPPKDLTTKQDPINIKLWRPTPAGGSACEPNVSALDYEASLNENGYLVLGSPITFNLIINACESNDIYNATLWTGTNFTPMHKNGAEDTYSATLSVDYWGFPIAAEVKYANETVIARRELWQLPVIVPPGGSTSLPTAVISSNLKYAHHVGDIVSNLACYTDAQFADFHWTITRPDGINNEYTAQIIPSYQLDLEGRYAFKCEVSVGDVMNYDIRNVDVYQPEVQIPVFSINGPSSTQVDTPTNFRVGNPDTANYDYSWEFGDGGTYTGTDIWHTFRYAGANSVKLTATWKDDPTRTFEKSQDVFVSSYPVPNASIQGPTSAPVNTNVTFSVPQPTPGATYTWIFGDGGTGSGTVVTHRYTQTGDFEVEVFADNNGTTNSNSWDITIY